MKELLKTPIFNVVEKDEVESGLRPIGVDAPDWVSIIVEKNNKFLIVRQLRYGTMKETIEFPCGTVEKGEFVEDAAIRELEEETGIKIAKENKYSVHLINICSPNPAFMMNKKYTFYVNLNDGAYEFVGQNLDEHEHITYEWVDKYYLTRIFGTLPDQPAMFGTSLFAYWNYKGLFEKLDDMRKCLM